MDTNGELINNFPLNLAFTKYKYNTFQALIESGVNNTINQNDIIEISSKSDDFFETFILNIKNPNRNRRIGWT